MDKNGHFGYINAMKLKLQPTQNETRAETLRRTLESEILSGTLRPGSRLDEVELAARFGVSRTPVRQALHELAAGGLVEIKSRQGACVSSLSIATLLEMFQMMAELEGLCASFAARRARPEQRRQLKEIHERLVRSFNDGDPEDFYEVNREFHEAVYAAANAEFIADHTLVLRNRVSPYRRYVTFQPGRMAATLDEHAAVLNAILASNPAAAQQAMRDHVNLLGDNLTDFIAAIPAETLKVG
jgi:DNA-binding GntR family transcriptional regulator